MVVPNKYGTLTHLLGIHVSSVSRYLGDCEGEVVGLKVR